MRYQMVLLPCDGTSKSYWNQVIAEAPSILSLWDKAGWNGGVYSNQMVGIKDTKTGKVLNLDEYAVIVHRLKGW